MEVSLWVRLKYRTIARAIEALLMAGDHEHQRARETSGAQAKAHRDEAEEFHAAKSDLWSASHQDMKIHSVDESVSGNSAPVQITRFSLPKDARELIASVVMALSIMTSVYIYETMNQKLQDVTSKLHDAYRDIQTQVWLKQDKEEEKFQKFVAGPYAQLAGELKANEILIQQCKEKH